MEERLEYWLSVYAADPENQLLAADLAEWLKIVRAIKNRL